MAKANITDDDESAGKPVIYSGIDWNEAFTADLLDHKLLRREGGMGQWEYSVPEFEGDPVAGSSLWVEFLKEHPEYYILNAEIQLAKEAASILPQHVAEPVALIFLGIGNSYAFKRKDLTVTKEFNRVISASAIDLSEEYINQAFLEMGKARPDVKQRVGYLQDMFGGFNIPKGKIKNAKRLVTTFGATLFNVNVKRDEGQNLLMPEDAVRERLASIRGSLDKGDFFVVTNDANQDKEKIEAAYRGQTAFASNLAHRIKRDTPHKDIDTENVKFRVEYDEASHILGHYLTLNFNDNGGPKEMLINISPKIPAETFLTWCKKEKFKQVRSISNDGVYLHLLEAS
jgi:uncharacterized SAM-dependent methyltransferase